MISSASMIDAESYLSKDSSTSLPFVGQPQSRDIAAMLQQALLSKK
jgi:hypothetical protein